MVDNETKEKVEITAESLPLPETPPPPVEPITIKDPRKIEQGKRLAAISKAAKEKKMREKIEAEMRLAETEKKMSIPIPIVVGIPVISGYLLYRYFSNKREKPTIVESPSASPSLASPESPPLSQEKKSKKFETLG